MPGVTQQQLLNLGSAAHEDEALLLAVGEITTAAFCDHDPIDLDVESHYFSAGGLIAQPGRPATSGASARRVRITTVAEALTTLNLSILAGHNSIRTDKVPYGHHYGKYMNIINNHCRTLCFDDQTLVE